MRDKVSKKRKPFTGHLYSSRLFLLNINLIYLILSLKLHCRTPCLYTQRHTLLSLSPCGFLHLSLCLFYFYLSLCVSLSLVMSYSLVIISSLCFFAYHRSLPFSFSISLYLSYTLLIIL